MSGRYALIIGNTEYIDPGLAQLTAPSRDAEDFARVLKDQEIGGFDEVNILLNQTSSTSIEAIDEFFDQKKPDDLLVLYFSGHGVRDELGALYLAVKNTNRFRLRSTAIKSDFIREAMDQSRSKRQVLIMDCCNSGAFAQGTKAATGVSIGTASAFEAGYGRIILTASDATQFAWEGDRVMGETDNSLFTHFLVKGLEGEADSDSDGRITVDELYDYAYEKVKFVTPKQTPSKFSSKQQGEIVLRQSMRIEDIKPVALPAELIDEIEDLRPYVRQAAVEKLEKLIKGRNIGLARSARETLERVAAQDDSYRVRQVAAQALASPTKGEAVPKVVEDVKVGPTASEATAAGTVKEVKKKPPTRKENRAGQAMQKSQNVVIPNIAEKGLERPILTNKNEVKAERVIQPRSLIPQRFFSPLGAIVLIIALTLSLGGFYVLRNAVLKPAATSPVTEEPAMTKEPAFPISSESPAATELIIPKTGHIINPADDPSAPKLVHDAESSGTGPEGRAPYGDSYKFNRLERPFLQENMTYISDLDIDQFGLSEDEDWYYISIILIGDNPNSSLEINYGAEIDLDGDGFGDFIIWAHPPYSSEWDTSTVQVFQDSDHDTAGVNSGRSDAVFDGNGYDKLIFDGATDENSDADLAWVRVKEGQPATIQLAFKKSLIGDSFMFGVIADAGLKDISKFDYNDRFTEADAGSSVQDNRYYPLGALYAVDNSCWETHAIRTTSTLKLCPSILQPTKKPSGDASQPTSSGCINSPQCPAGWQWDPQSCGCLNLNP